MAASLRRPPPPVNARPLGGATGFIPKPFTEPELRAEAAAVLQRRPALVDPPACPGRRSGEAEIPRVVVVDRVGAGRAVPAGFQGGAAGEVTRAPGGGGAGGVRGPRA